MEKMIIGAYKQSGPIEHLRGLEARLSVPQNADSGYYFATFPRGDLGGHDIHYMPVSDFEIKSSALYSSKVAK